MSINGNVWLARKQGYMLCWVGYVVRGFISNLFKTADTTLGIAPNPARIRAPP